MCAFFCCWLCKRKTQGIIVMLWFDWFVFRSVPVLLFPQSWLLFSLALPFCLTSSPSLHPPLVPALFFMQILPLGRHDHARRQRASDAKIHPRRRGGKEERAVFREDQEVQDERRRLGAHHEEQRRCWGGACPGLMDLWAGSGAGCGDEGVGRDLRRGWAREGWGETCAKEQDSTSASRGTTYSVRVRVKGFESLASRRVSSLMMTRGLNLLYSVLGGGIGYN